MVWEDFIAPFDTLVARWLSLLWIKPGAKKSPDKIPRILTINFKTNCANGWLAADLDSRILHQ
jgi:hypothetical protein